MSKESRVEPLPEPAQIEYVPELIRPFAESVTNRANEIFAPARKMMAPGVNWKFVNHRTYFPAAEYIPNEHNVFVYMPFADDIQNPVAGIHGKIKMAIGKIPMQDRVDLFRTFRKLEVKYGNEDLDLWQMYCDNLYKSLTNELPYKARRNYARRFSKRVDSFFQSYLEFSDLEKYVYIECLVHELQHAEFAKRSDEMQGMEFLKFHDVISENLQVIEENNPIPKKTEKYIETLYKSKRNRKLEAHQIKNNFYLQELARHVDNQDEVVAHVTYMIWSSIDEEISQNITDSFFNLKLRNKRNTSMYDGGYDASNYYSLSSPVSEYLRSRIVRRPIKYIGYRLANLYEELFDGGVLVQLIDHELSRASHHFNHTANRRYRG